MVSGTHTHTHTKYTFQAPVGWGKTSCPGLCRPIFEPNEGHQLGGFQPENRVLFEVFPTHLDWQGLKPKVTKHLGFSIYNLKVDTTKASSSVAHQRHLPGATGTFVKSLILTGPHRKAVVDLPIRAARHSAQGIA